jgi:hypothetical protein
MKILLVLLIFLGMFSVVCQAREDSLRCKSGLVMLGESKLEIVSKCGEPASKDTSERRAPGHKYVTIEEWTYNFGPSDFIHVLEFEGSTLKAIKRGDRGF